MVKSANEAIDHIHSLSRFGKKAGLSNITLMLERLGNPQKGQKFVHVAGTNGKGSVSNMIKNILTNHGYKVGYYTSPYIEFFSERICINNEMISDSDLVHYTNRVMDVCDGINPIEFEFITAMAFLYFKEQKCDITVLEVGLGGRFDATNIIDTPLLNVITPIGFDHTAILGDTLEKIAFEKAGTIKENSTVVISPDMAKECTAVIEERCHETSSELIIPKCNAKNVEYSLPCTTFEYDNEKYELSLLGTYQVGNAICAIEASRALSKKIDLSQTDINAGLKNSFWKCRFERFDTKPEIVLDGAHNSHGVKALMESIEAYYPNKKRVFLFSMLGEKDWRNSASLISKHTDSVILTIVPGIRETPADELKREFESLGVKCEYYQNPETAFEKAKEEAGENDVLFAFGSLYLSGCLRKYVKEFL
ncbi:MAG: bifunctional folylpolyglutamate synthase/dihydrofolate synthase [Clostridia bacterium]|nr:bifunctional folylpolyglutamate synthase/dihydrofolate synthase [Clostridia bacterium]